MILPLHILGGVLALVFGYTALVAVKGGALHRKAGLGFVAAMIVLSLSGALAAALNSTTSSVIAGLLTFYFVVTGMLTVRGGRRMAIDRAFVLVAIVVGLYAFRVGADLASQGRPETVPIFIFGSVAMLGAIGDVRMIRAGGIEGHPRLKRHLWRMCFGMWVAAASFFWGPPNRVPEVIRIPALLPIPVLAPIVVMFYWLWRMRRRRTAGEARLPEQIVEVMP